MTNVPFAEKPIILFTEGSRAQQRYTLDTAVLTIGREPTCEIVLTEREISRQHVQVKMEDSLYYLEDLDSKNGTWINHTQIKGRYELHSGDEINLGKVVTFVYYNLQETATGPMILTENGRIRLNRETRRVFVGEREINPPLSLPQYRLLELLLDAQGRICTRDEVVKTVWPDAQNEGISEHAIDALVRRLRDRITELEMGHQFVVTVRGHGFRLDNQG
jgi:DNA-binding winged helix-turn-helix (wHTH) protein